jgi:hypothetical protein
MKSPSPRRWKSRNPWEKRRLSGAKEFACEHETGAVSDDYAPAIGVQGKRNIWEAVQTF